MESLLLQRRARDTRLLADNLVANCAIATLPGLPLQRVLVGALHWAGPSTAFLFPAFGECIADVHVIHYTELQKHSVGICFLGGTQIHGLLSSLAQSAVEDPDDYAVAWTLWQEVLPLRRTLIADAFAQLEQTRFCSADDAA